MAPNRDGESSPWTCTWLRLESRSCCTRTRVRHLWTRTRLETCGLDSDFRTWQTHKLYMLTEPVMLQILNQNDDRPNPLEVSTSGWSENKLSWFLSKFWSKRATGTMAPNRDGESSPWTCTWLGFESRSWAQWALDSSFNLQLESLVGLVPKKNILVRTKIIFNQRDNPQL